MQPKCPKCANDLQIGKAKMYCNENDCRWEETTIHELVSRTKGQEVYSIATIIMEYLVSQAVRLGVESARLTAIEEAIATLERGRDKEGDMKL